MTNTTDKTPVHCDNCDWRGDIDDTLNAGDIEERCTPGGEVPAGECPDCGTLAYLDNNPWTATTDAELKTARLVNEEHRRINGELRREIAHLKTMARPVDSRSPLRTRFLFQARDERLRLAALEAGAKPGDYVGTYGNELIKVVRFKPSWTLNTWRMLADGQMEWIS
jgi:hypothetical protein